MSLPHILPEEGERMEGGGKGEKMAGGKKRKEEKEKEEWQ